MAKASKATLSRLHERFAEVLLEVLNDEATKVAQPELGGVNAAALGVVRGFLKDNEITGGEEEGALENLRSKYNSALDSRREVAEAITQEIQREEQLSLLMH